MVLGYRPLFRQMCMHFCNERVRFQISGWRKRGVSDHDKHLVREVIEHYGESELIG